MPGLVRITITQAWGERLGGAETMLGSFLRHVDRTMIEPLVVFLWGGTFEREVAALGISTRVLDAGRLRQVNRFVRAVRSLAAVLREARPGLVLNWSAKAQVYGAVAAAMAGMSGRVVWWQHEVPNGHWLDRLATALPARAVGCSSTASARAQERLHPIRKTFVVHPGIDSTDNGNGTDRQSLRRRLGIPNGRFVVGIVGRLHPSKAQDRVLRAVAGLRRRGFDLHALIVGGDPFGLSPGYDARLRRLADDVDLRGAVTFTGHVPDAMPYLAALDVMVNASAAEPFGIVLAEAMAQGVPVIAVDAAGPRDIVESERSGLLVPPDDDGALAGAVERTLLDPALRLKLAAAGQQRARSLFTAPAMTHALQARLLGLGRTEGLEMATRPG